MFKVTKDQLDYFGERAYFWQREFGVLDNELIIRTGKLEEHVLAEYKKYSTCGTIHITLTDECDRELSHYELDMCAFHEVFEAGYLSELRSMAEASSSNYDVEKETHRVVRMAENTIFNYIRHRGEDK